MLLALFLLISHLSGSNVAEDVAPVMLSEAELIAEDVERGDTLEDALPAAYAPSPPNLSARALIEAEHAQFAAADAPDIRRVEAVVRRGQTFASVLDGAGASRVDAARAIAALEPLFPARRLRAGQELTIFMETPSETDRIAADLNEEALPERRLAGFSFQADADRTLTVARVGDQFRAREAVTVLERQLVRATGEVDSSLYLSAVENGATDQDPWLRRGLPHHPARRRLRHGL